MTRRPPTIAFVAMSGVRVRSRELNELGVTLPGFVERGHVIAGLPSLGLLTLAALTPDDHEISYHESEDVTAEMLADLGVDLVALSTMTAQAPEAYELLGACRSLGMRTAIGGLHATQCPREAGRHADHVFVGEGERTWPRFLDDLRAGRPAPLYDARRLEPFDLADAPLPRWDLLDPTRYNRITVQTTRGCPRACNFCASSVLLKGPYRKKPVERVIEELAAVRAMWRGEGAPFVEFADDNTFVDPDWSLDLVEAIAALPRRDRPRWFTETEISLADERHAPVLERLADAGCRQVLVGLEATSQQVAAGLEDRPFKAARVPDYGAAVERIQQAGVSVNTCFTAGADGQDAGVFDAVERFVRRVGPAEVQLTLLTPFPGTPLRRRLEAEGRILPQADPRRVGPQAWGLHTLFDACHRPRDMSLAAMERGLLRSFARLYEADAVRERRRAFHDHVRAGAVAGARRREPHAAVSTASAAIPPGRTGL